MLKTLRLQNFQKHKKLLIEFDPHITTIIGPTDSGKSSVIRALNYLTFNTPSGTAIIRDGANGCTVSLEVDDKTIKRRRGKDVNHYEIDGKKLEAFGKGGVPDEVKEALKLDRLNFQYQHDSPLWLSENAGQVAKNLNEIVNLDLIDRVLTRLGRQARALGTELTICSNRLIRAKVDSKELEWVSNAEESFQKVEDAQTRLDKINTKHTQLLALIGSIRTLKKRCESLESTIEPLEQEVLELKESHNKALQAVGFCRELKTLLASVKDKKKECQEIKIRMDQAQAKLAEVKACPMCLRPFDNKTDIPL